LDYLEVTQLFAAALREGEIKGSPEGNPSIPWPTPREFMDRLEELRRTGPPV